MSMTSWVENGYGFELFTNNNFDKVKSFIHNNIKEWNKNVEEDTIDNILNSEDDADLEDTLNEPVTWVIATIVNNLENTNIFSGYNACDDTNQEAMIGIAPLYPWQIKKPLSIDEANALLNKYAKELGITEEPNYFAAEYFG